MATNDQKSAKEGSRSLKAHKEPDRLASHPEQARLEAHKEEDEAIVPAVTADVDETPKFIKYGAAVLLGLAFGAGCYVWYDRVPSAPENPQTHFTVTEDGNNYFLSPYDNFYAYSEVTDEEMLSPFTSDSYTQVSGAVTPVSANESNAEVSLASASAIPVVVYLFQYDSSTIPETKALTDIAGQASKAGVSLDVKAYTDEHGRAVYNQRLSERRARAIADYLIAHGMPASKVTTHAMGPTHTFGSDAADRRAEVTPVRQ